jgi:hypothetical protein
VKQSKGNTCADAQLSSWIGNVDALVEGVEKVSFWGSMTRKR